MATETQHGHIQGENHPDLDVYLNGERMTEYDAVSEGIVMRHRESGRVVKITVIYTDGLRVGGMLWDDPDDAWATQGEDLRFDRVGDAGDIFARFEAREHDFAVELREVEG